MERVQATGHPQFEEMQLPRSTVDSSALLDFRVHVAPLPRGLSLILVEDMTIQRRNEASRREGFDVGEAADGESGLEMARGGAYDLVLLDLMLPGIPGTEVCRRLRSKIEPDPSNPVRLVTVRGLGYKLVSQP